MTYHKRILMTIGSQDLAGLRRTIAHALKRGTSPRGILDLLERSLKGTFRPHSQFSEKDHDIAFLVKAIGGPRLLYALSQSHGLPSARSIFRDRRVPTLVPSVAVPTPIEVRANIDAFFDPSVKPAPDPLSSGMLPGHILMVDGIAIEPKPRYDSTRDCMLGFARETVSNITTSLEHPEAIEQARQALNEEPKSVSLGIDATMVVLGPYADTKHYSVSPIALSASDKKEKGPALAQWLSMVIEEYEQHP
jgi:hypothetical protein